MLLCELAFAEDSFKACSCKVRGPFTKDSAESLLQPLDIIPGVDSDSHIVLARQVKGTAVKQHHPVGGKALRELAHAHDHLQPDQDVRRIAPLRLVAMPCEQVGEAGPLLFDILDRKSVV